ncbi:DUF6428 family protein [Niabella soli]|uniref:Uncharacterized protein n=1 Tax=Niabella soli DSM 19437 TaxID=929713 RepID=W0F0H4_9BACT|nr:DUF6428 family protein [Niabella soli]AHF14949.1 hypothetical protein NIASO_06840 [Niabella soli DSM 19437]
MKLSAFKALLPALEQVIFRLEDGPFVPGHFHVTEVGIVTKHFIDCGGTIRNEKTASFQLWHANDLTHRLPAAKLLHIIQLSEEKLGIGNLDIEVEYQNDTIGKYDLEFDGSTFILITKKTACLAEDKCGAPSQKTKTRLSELPTAQTACCTPGSNCC